MVLLNIRPRRLLEKKLREQWEMLLRSEQLTSLGTIAGGIAHEVSNPNQIIMLNASYLKQLWQETEALLQQNSVSDKTVEIAGMKLPELVTKIPGHLEDLSIAADRINNIVKGLKDYIQEDMEKAVIDPNKVIESAVDLSSSLIDQHTKRFRMDLSAGIPKISGNFKKIEQVIRNVLENSCLALENREESIVIRSGYDTADGVVKIEIEDQGGGVKAENIARLTDPFYTTRPSSGGTGLGLAVSYRIVRQHGGKMHFSSEPGIGTIVRLSFPVSRATTFIYSYNHTRAASSESCTVGISNSMYCREKTKLPFLA